MVFEFLVWRYKKNVHVVARNQKKSCHSLCYRKCAVEKRKNRFRSIGICSSNYSVISKYVAPKIFLYAGSRHSKIWMVRSEEMYQSCYIYIFSSSINFHFIILQVYFGTSHARMYLAANFIGINCATGMSELVRKEILEAEGGLEAFGKYLAEDYFIAQAVQDRGLYTVICSQPALQNAGDSSIQLFQSRITRLFTFCI